MSDQSNVVIAKSISIAGCESCRCGATHIRFHDASGAVIACASMDLDMAVAFTDQLVETVKAACERDMLACEGTA